MKYAVVPKDWERMQDLIDRNQDGDGVASKIKDVGKAVARFVAGTVLAGDKDDVLRYERFYHSRFRAFGVKAVDLGAKVEDILETLKEASVPETFSKTHVTKKTYSGYTGSLERFLDKMEAEKGVKFTWESTDSKDWSYYTKEQYRRNGRVWPLNYKITAEREGKVKSFTVIVVTNEGGGLYGYDFNGSRMPWGMVKDSIERLLDTL